MSRLDPDRIGAVACREDGVPEAPEHPYHEIAHRRLILGHEHGLGAVKFGLWPLAFVRLLRCPVGARKVAHDRRADAHCAHDRHKPAALFGDAIDGRESKSCTLAERLRREERLEHPFEQLGGNAVARVLDGDRRVRPRRRARVISDGVRADLDVRRANREAAALRHCVARVHGQVHH